MDNFICERCNKRFKHWVIISKIDRKYICEKCAEKEEPKYLFDKITDLEAKLAESEDRIAKARRQAYSSRQMDNTLKIRRLADEITAKEKAITKLKQQLAEKDQQILALQEDSIRDNQIYNVELAEKEKEKEDWIRAFEELALDSIDHESYNATVDEYEKEIEELKIYQNQTAIAELEKVKEWLEPKYFDKEQINYLTNAIDQQIKSLKGESK